MQSIVYTTSVENSASDVVDSVSDVENVGRLLELLNFDISSEVEKSRHNIAANQLQSLNEKHTKESMNNENFMADITDGGITKSPAKNITLHEDVSYAIQI